MKILYIHQYFKTPEEGGCTRSYHLAKGLIAGGYEVEMITSHDSKQSVENIDGIKVRYLHIPYSNHFGFLKRMHAFYRFVKLAIRESEKVSNVDLAYVMTTPLSTGLIAQHLKKKRGIPYYFEVGDLWPEAPVQMGVVKNHFLKSMLYRFERTCYREAKRVVALSPDIRDYIKQIVPESKIDLVTNISHCEYYEPKFNVKVFTNENTFRIGYFGTLGKANGLEVFLNLAKESEKTSLPIEFHIMGEGSELENLQKIANQSPNVLFHDFGSKEKVKEMLDQMDGIYVSFKNIPVLSTGSPNKFFDGLAAGKLIVINFKGWIKQVIESSNCGFYHSPESTREFVDGIKSYIDNPETLVDAQKNARKLGESSFDKKQLIAKLIKSITIS
ncbi:MAG: glycosyltransferase family 4 protein [Cyclobacteriaceae bacterium]